MKKYSRIVFRLGEGWVMTDNNRLPSTGQFESEVVLNKIKLVTSLKPRIRRLVWTILDPVVIQCERIVQKMRSFVDNLYIKNVEEYMEVNLGTLPLQSNPNDGLETMQQWAHPESLKKYNSMKKAGWSYRTKRIEFYPKLSSDNLKEDIADVIRQDNKTTKD